LKKSRLQFLFVTFVLVIGIGFAAQAQHGFSVPQYEEFHDVLHPLEHEALPKHDFKTIRAKAPELVRRGKAIVAVGVPAGTADDRKADFSKQLKAFDKALGKFRSDARTGSNTRLKKSYSAVHDQFEMLASMLPRS
jgi:hypothetical protein